MRRSLPSPRRSPRLPRALLALLAGAAPAAGQDPAAPPKDPPTAPPASGGAAPSDDAFHLGSPPSLPEGTTEEEMWPAATAEEWQQPVLVAWQRTFDDALRVARAEGRPILVAVNMDGEIASEHFAGIRYRDPETAARMEPYVCIVASVYRHAPRDYDEAGRRIECPRFGTVTCGEHIEAERELYERYFEGRRVAPRHIVLNLEGEETYDVYFAWDTATVLETFRKGVEGWPAPAAPAEPTLEYLVTSADVEDREALEHAYEEGDAAAKRSVLELLTGDGAVDQVEVLRSALFGFDDRLASLARRALARCETEPALELLAEALKAPLESEERDLLLDAVDRLAERLPRARTLAAVHDGLAVESQHVDARVVASLAREYEASRGRTADVDGPARAAEERPDDPEAQLELAAALLGRAASTRPGHFARLLLEDARSAALRAERLGARGPRLAAILAVAAAEQGDRAEARARAVAAVEQGLLAGGADETDLGGVPRARVLRLFADARRRAIRAAYRAGEAWPPDWLSDFVAAQAILAEGGLDESELVEHHDFLRWIGATPRANEVLEDALERFPDSAALHQRLRGRLLWDGGPQALERAYTGRLAEGDPGDASQLTWFAGYASLLAAEHHRRRGERDAALAAYERSVERFERNAELFPGGADGCRHYVALCHAGRARVALERGALGRATGALLKALRARPASAASQDGLGITPLATAKMLRTALLEAGDEEHAARLDAALPTLDPELLEPPPSEQPPAPRGGPDRGR